MTLVEQLRARADNPDAIYSSNDAKRDRDAADEIEKLHADIRALNRELDSWEEKSRHD